MTLAATIGLAGTGAAAAWYLREKARRRTRPMPGGLHPEIRLPHTAEFELWHNALSLCSKKVRLCLDELGLPYVAHHVDLIETGSYQTLSREFLAVNPAALVPVLVHEGHPVYESHEIIRYAAERSPSRAMLPRDSASLRHMEEWVRRSSLTGDDPTRGMRESAGNCIPGLTIPLFAAMIAGIPTLNIVEGLLFHRLKKRPLSFLALKAAGLRRLPSLPPAMRILRESREQMLRHLDALESHLAAMESDVVPAGEPCWIAGREHSLADVSWAVIFERLREADWTALLEDPRRPRVGAWWKRIRERPSYRSAMLGAYEHPLVVAGTAAIRRLKKENPDFARTVYG